MSLRIFFAAALSALAIPAAAAAQEVTAFDTFELLCVKTRGAPAAALAVADAAGWMQIPDALVKDVSRKNEMSDVDGRIKTTDQAFMFIAVGTAIAYVEAKPVRMRACAMGVAPADLPPLLGRLAVWAAVPGDLVGGNVKAGYTFADDDGVHRQLTPHQKDSLATYRSGHLVSVTLEEYQDALLVILAVPNFEAGH